MRCTKVEHANAPIAVHQNVGRLEIRVNDSPRVRVRNRSHHRLEHAQLLCMRTRSSSKPCAQRLTLHKFHGKPRPTLDSFFAIDEHRSAIKERHNARMMKLREEFLFRIEASAQRGRDSSLQKALDGDASIGMLALAKQDNACAAAPEFAKDAVLADFLRKRGLELEGIVVDLRAQRLPDCPIKKCFGGRVGFEKRAEMLRHRPVFLREFAQRSTARNRFKCHQAMERCCERSTSERFSIAHVRTCDDKECSSEARAKTQSACAVEREHSTISAITFIGSPPKKRSSTICAARGELLRSAASASLSLSRSSVVRAGSKLRFRSNSV